MSDKTKRPTPQDYHAIRRYLTFGFRKSVALTLNDPGEYRAAGDTLAHLLGVIDRAEQQTAGVPEVEAPEDAGEQPPTDPEARVAAMTNAQVEAGLTERGVEAWWPFAGRMFRPRRGDLQALTVEGFCYPPTEGGAMQPFDEVKGDTTTPEGRAECSRRLLAHLLRAEESK